MLVDALLDLFFLSCDSFYEQRNKSQRLLTDQSIKGKLDNNNVCSIECCVSSPTYFHQILFRSFFSLENCSICQCPPD